MSPRGITFRECICNFTVLFNVLLLIFTIQLQTSNITIYRGMCSYRYKGSLVEWICSLQEESDIVAILHLLGALDLPALRAGSQNVPEERLRTLPTGTLGDLNEPRPLKGVCAEAPPNYFPLVDLQCFTLVPWSDWRWSQSPAVIWGWMGFSLWNRHVKKEQKKKFRPFLSVWLVSLTVAPLACCVSHWAESETRLPGASQLPGRSASELGLRGLKNKEQVASSRLHYASSAKIFAAGARYVCQFPRMRRWYQGWGCRTGAWN